jgi:hypothetical protein
MMKNSKFQFFNSLKSHEVITDKLNRKKVKIFVYKGKPVASKEFTDGTDRSDRRLRLFRLKVDFLGLKNEISVENLIAVKEFVESVDIDHTILEYIFSQFFDRREKARKLIAPLLEVYDSAKEGQLIGDITLDYSDFEKFVKFLSFITTEPMKRDVNL